MVESRRKYTRYAVPVEVEITGPGGLQRCLTDDVGAGGCRVKLAIPLPSGTLLKVRLHPPGGGVGPSGPARIAWASQEEGGVVGLAFSPPLIEACLPFLRALTEAASAPPLEDEAR